MKKRFLKHTATLFFIFILLVNCEDDPVSNNKNKPSNIIEQEVNQLINQHRISIGLAELEWSEIIAAECRNHSIDMANAHTINHDGFYDRVNKIRESIPWNWAGENVACNYSAQGADTAWFNSPGHKGNIESNSNLTGVGVAFDEDSTIYFTQIFIRSSE